MEKVLYSKGAWYVTPTGIYNKNNGYFILKGQLDKVDWVSHLSGEKDFNRDDFLKVFNYAKSHL